MLVQPPRIGKAASICAGKTVGSTATSICIKQCAPGVVSLAGDDSDGKGGGEDFEQEPDRSGETLLEPPCDAAVWRATLSPRARGALALLAVLHRSAHERLASPTDF